MEIGTKDERRGAAPGWAKQKTIGVFICSISCEACSLLESSIMNFSEWLRWINDGMCISHEWIYPNIELYVLPTFEEEELEEAEANNKLDSFIIERLKEDSPNIAEIRKHMYMHFGAEITRAVFVLDGNNIKFHDVYSHKVFKYADDDCIERLISGGRRWQV